MSKMPNWARAGVAGAFFTFVTLFGLAVLDVLADLIKWASEDNAPLPDLAVFAKATVVAIASAATGLVNAVIRWAQERAQDGSGLVARLIARTGNPPVYPTTQR